MGAKKKEHRKKVANRNLQIKNRIKKDNQFKEEMIMRMIEQEKAAGKFENNPSISSPSIDLGEGPQF